MFFFVDRNKTMIQMSNTSIFAVFGVSIAILLAFYVLRSIGLFVLAKKNDYKHAFLAFIPFAWTYLAGTMVKDDNFLGFKMKRVALYFVLVFSFAEVLSLVYNFILYFPIVGYYLSGTDGTAKIYYLLYPSQTIIDNMKSMGCVQYPLNGSVFCYGNFQYPYALAMENVLPALRIISLIADLAQLVFTISLFFNLFRKFWPEHFILASILSIFGFFPIFVFAVRNRKAVDYREFISEKYGMYMGGASQANNGDAADSQEPFADFADDNKGDGANGENAGGKADDGVDPFEDFPDKKD